MAVSTVVYDYKRGRAGSSFSFGKGDSVLGDVTEKEKASSAA